MRNINIVDNFATADKVLRIYKSQIALAFDKNKKIQKAILFASAFSLLAFLINMVFYAAFAVRENLFYSTWVTWTIILVLGVFTVLFASFLLLKYIGHVNNFVDLIKSPDKSTVVSNAVNEKFGVLPSVWKSCENNTLYQLRFLESSTDGCVVIDFFFSSPDLKSINEVKNASPSLRTVREAKTDFTIELSSDSYYIDRIMIDLLNRTVITHYTSSFSYGSLYNMIEEDSDYEDYCIL